MFNIKSALVVSISLCSFLFISGCTKPTPHMTKPKPHLSPEQKKCAIRCAHENERCNKQYQKIYEQCVMQARERAQLDYHAYLNNQLTLKKKRQDVKKTYHDFFDTHHCKQQLMCKADYVLCYKNCGL